MKTRTIVPILIALALLGARPAAAEGAAPEGDKDFKPVTTHIEADCWSVLKIERPEPAAPRPSAIEQAAEDKMTVDALNLMAVVSHQYRDDQHRLRAGHFGLVEFPSNFSFNRHGYHNGYFFSCYDQVALRKYAGADDRTGQVTFYRTALLDIPIAFTGFKFRYDAPGRTYWEALDLPLSTTIAHEADRDKSVWKVLNVPLVWGFRYERNGKTAETHVLDVPLAALFTGHSSEAERNSWTLVDIPFFKLASGERSKTRGEIKLVDFSCLAHVYLWRQESTADSTRLGFLRLPILGPLFSVRSDKTGTHAGVFSGLFSHE